MKTYTCTCGGKIKESKAVVEGFVIDALVCEKCAAVTLTPDIAKQLLRLRAQAEKIQSERRVVRIGNSIGVTLPPEAEAIGFTEGRVVEMQVTGNQQISIKPKETKR